MPKFELGAHLTFTCFNSEEVSCKTMKKSFDAKVRDVQTYGEETS